MVPLASEMFEQAGRAASFRTIACTRYTSEQCDRPSVLVLLLEVLPMMMLKFSENKALLAGGASCFTSPFCGGLIVRP